MHRLKQPIRVLALLACVLLASCVPQTEARLAAMATPRVDGYARLLVRQMLARDTAAMAHRFSPGLMQVPHAADSLAAIARYFPYGIKSLRLVGVRVQWNNNLTSRLLQYEARAEGGAYMLLVAHVLEDDLHNLYVDGLFAQELEGPVPPGAWMPLPGFPWRLLALALLVGTVITLVLVFRKRSSRPVTEIPLYPGSPVRPAARPGGAAVLGRSAANPDAGADAGPWAMFAAQTPGAFPPPSSAGPADQNRASVPDAAGDPPRYPEADSGSAAPVSDFSSDSTGFSPGSDAGFSPGPDIRND